MIVYVYSIRDVLNGFAGLFTEVNDESAIRGFKLSLRDASAGNILGFVPTDFYLYCLGTYNTETGEIVSDVRCVYYGGDFYVSSETIK